MADLEKVINGLEESGAADCFDDEVICVKAWTVKAAIELLKAEEAKPLRCGGCSWFTQTQESGVGYCSFPNCEREVFDTEYCSWGAWTGKGG